MKNISFELISDISTDKVDNNCLPTYPSCPRHHVTLICHLYALQLTFSGGVLQRLLELPEPADLIHLVTEAGVGGLQIQLQVQGGSQGDVGGQGDQAYTAVSSLPPETSAAGSVSLEGGLFVEGH